MSQEKNRHRLSERRHRYLTIWPTLEHFKTSATFPLQTHRGALHPHHLLLKAMEGRVCPWTALSPAPLIRRTAGHRHHRLISTEATCEGRRRRHGCPWTLMVQSRAAMTTQLMDTQITIRNQLNKRVAVGGAQHMEAARVRHPQRRHSFPSKGHPLHQRILRASFL